MRINPKFFPTVMILLDLCSAVVWGYHGNIRQVIYWVAAGGADRRNGIRSYQKKNEPSAEGKRIRTIINKIRG